MVLIMHYFAYYIQAAAVYGIVSFICYKVLLSTAIIITATRNYVIDVVLVS